MFRLAVVFGLWLSSTGAMAQGTVETPTANGANASSASASAQVRVNAADASSASNDREITQAAEDEARARFTAGRALVESGYFRQARVEFQRGFELSRLPLFLFNMAECSRQLGNSDDARREYSEYLRRDAEGSFTSNARASLTELGDGDTSAPEFVVALESDSAPDLSAERVARDAHDNDANANPVVPQETSEAPGRRWYANWPFWTVVGIAVVGGAVAIGIVASRPGSPACGQGCTLVDWRDL